MKRQIWQKSQIWQKCQIWQKIWFEKNLNFEKDVNFHCILHLPHLAPIVYIWYHIFSVPKRNFEKTKRKQNLLWNSNSCDLDAELETWAASRWKLLMQYSRWFTVNDKFSQSRLKCTIWPKFIQSRPIIRITRCFNELVTKIGDSLNLALIQSPN